MEKYHINLGEREITSMNEIKTILMEGKYTTIALCNNNEPYIVSLSYGYDAKENILYFHTALKGLKLDIINDNPNVCATVIRDEGYVTGKCQHRYSSVVLWGKIEIISDLKENIQAMKTLINHLEPEPDKLKSKYLNKNSTYQKVRMLKLKIDKIIGKKGG